MNMVEITAPLPLGSPLPDRPTGERLNRLLRRVDWRVLLPTPEPRRVAVFGDEELGEALALVAENVVSGAMVDAGHCDVAIVRDPDPGVLRSAVRALEPGGTLYVETAGLGTVRAGRLQRRLESLGLQILGEYIVSHDRRTGGYSAWVPLTGSAALGYFAATRGKNHRPGTGLRRRAHRAVWGLRAGGYLPVTRALLARTPQPSSPRAAPSSGLADAPGSSTGAPDLLEAIRSLGQDRLVGGSSSSLLLLAPGRRSINKIIGFVFQSHEPVPSFVVKMPRIPEASTTLRNEEDVLRTLQGSGDRPMPGVPRMLFSGLHGRLPILGQSYVGGRPFAEALRSGSTERLAFAATDWLIHLGRHAPVAAEQRVPRALVDSVLQDFTGHFGPVLDPLLLRATADVLGTLGPMPVVCEQRDFSPWNLRVNAAGDLGVVDWESAVLNGLPLLDLLYFLTYLAFYLDRPVRDEAYLHSFRSLGDPRTHLGALRAECLRRYTNGLGLSEAAITPLRLLVWLVHARSEFCQLYRDQGAWPTPSALRKSLFLRLWTEEARALA